MRVIGLEMRAGVKACAAMPQAAGRGAAYFRERQGTWERRPGPDAAALIDAAIFSMISSISASLTISGGVSSIVSPARRGMMRAPALRQPAGGPFALSR